MPPISRIVYYFVYRTNKLSLLFSAIQNPNLYLSILISVNCGLASGWSDLKCQAPFLSQPVTKTDANDHQ